MKKSSWILAFGAASLLGLFSCAHSPTKPLLTFDTREAVVADGGIPGGVMATVRLVGAAGGSYQTQTITHKWVDEDIFQYEVTLKYYNGTTYVDFVPAIKVIVPRKVNPKTTAVFTNLRQGTKYRVSAIALGNDGGTAATTVLNSIPATAIFDFTASQDVNDSQSANLRVTLDTANFSGTGTALIQNPANGSYLNPSDPASGSLVAPMVLTLAGSTIGYANGSGVTAKFNNPRGIAVDASGNVYVADSLNFRIRKVSPTGVVSNFAGSGTQGYANGPGSTAQFCFPYGVAMDTSGYVYVADADGDQIRKISPSGVVSTLAGTGTNGFADGPGSTAQFDYPNGLAVDANGNVYVADTSNNRIRKVSPSGVVSTLAGSGTYGYVNGSGSTAQFRYPHGVAVDASGNVYVADTHNNRIRKVTPSGVVSTLAGSGIQGFADGPGSTAQFDYPQTVAVDANGNVYVADEFNHRIRKLSPTGVVSTFAGSGIEGNADGSGSTAQFAHPWGVAVDASGTVYVSDRENHRIRKIQE